MPWKEGYTISDEVGLRDEQVAWPDDRTAAVTVVVALSPAAGPEGITSRDLQSTAAYFGMHDGLDQVLALLSRYRIAATFAVPSVMAEIYQSRVQEIVLAGHEIAALGFKHEDVSRLTEQEEAERLRLTTDILERAAGRAPSGWYGLPRQDDPFAVGSISSNTIRLLLEAGYSYLGNSPADDIPHYWVSDFASRQAILALPYYYHFDDQYFCHFPRKGSGLEHPDMLARNWKAEFDAQYKRGRQFSMVLHPTHSGWCNRLTVVDEFLSYMNGFPNVWVTTARECAAHWSAAYPADQHLNLEAPIWQDYEGSLS